MYVFILTSDLRTRVGGNTYRIIIASKLLFFLIPIYLHNLILVRLLLDKGRLIGYALGVALLLATSVAIESQVVKLYNSEPVPLVYILSGQVFDLITGAGALFFYRYITQRHMRQQQQLLQRQNELKQLQERLDQHFLFNSLNTIYSYIQSNPALASTLMEQLSSLLRYQLEKSHLHNVRLSEEIDFIQSYLLLQETRLHEQAKINFTLEGDSGSLTIAPLLFIPFIENAFKHAHLGTSESAIDLNINIDDSTLTMELTNTYCKTSTSTPSLQLGLSNATKRLQLLYPQHTLNIRQEGNLYLVYLQLNLAIS